MVRLVNTVDVFLQCSRQTQQNVSDLLEVTTMVDYLMLRLRISLQEPWVKTFAYRCRCVIAARVVFPELRRVVVDFLYLLSERSESVRAISFVVFLLVSEECPVSVWVFF